MSFKVSAEHGPWLATRIVVFAINFFPDFQCSVLFCFSNLVDFLFPSPLLLNLKLGFAAQFFFQISYYG